ncbi:MAG TPA: PDZ domain-containing protein [Gammaproteobacteria bacterium]|nr:PDZ domain-containing protein [Gammaproteobacteria bacterium]
MSKWLLVLLALGVCGAAQAADSHLLLLRSPTMSKTEIAFEYGGEIWTVPRAGGQAHVLASGMDMLMKPIFSPNGSTIVFTGTYDHNTDVYIVPAAGGQPRRLTYHPGPDVAIGWTPDGKSVLFRSHRHSFSDPDQLYTVSVKGGFPQQLPLPAAEQGAYSPDGSHLAYVPGFQWEPFWKYYKGGQTTQLWIAKLADSSVVQVPGKSSNENDPMWIDNTVYFLSDRDGPNTLFAYDTGSGNVRRVIDNKGFDITAASAGPGGIVYSQFGQLHVYDFATDKAHRIVVTVKGDLPQRRPYYEDVSDDIVNSGVSPNGVRAVFEAHGEILTVPTEHGSVVNVTHTPGAADREPAWSPDGKNVAWFSDRDGEYDLYIGSQDGVGKTRKISLGQDNAYYYNPTWSPDSHQLVFSDQKLNLWYVDLRQDEPRPMKIETDSYLPLSEFDATWSPDSRWIAYTKVMPNYLHAVYVYSVADHKAHQVTDGSSDSLYPAFDAKGKYLYFTASTNTALTSGWLGMSSLARPVTRDVYAVMLEQNEASPIAPKGGFEKAESSDDKNKKKGDKQPPKVNIDFADIASRIVSLPIAPANYAGLSAGESGVLYLQKAPAVILPSDFGRNGVPVSVSRFELDSKKTKSLVDGVTDFVLAANGKKMLYRKGSSWFVSDAKPDAKPSRLDIAHMRVFVKPAEQWAEMYRDAWRIERAFFYNPLFDGLDVHAAEAEFAHYLPGIASRSGLTFLFHEMMSYMSVGHMFVRGGYHPKMEEIRVGLLGANYKIDNGHYRITRIFTDGKWNPDLYAPLAQPGLKVKVGDYVLAVNGKPLDAHESIYKAFEDLADKAVTLTVGPSTKMDDAHDVVVKTISREQGLRNTAWIVHNKQLVDKLSDGKLAYVYLPNTGWGGYTSFNRYFFSQVDKQGVILDERFNHGGLLSDYIINILQLKPRALGVTRWGTQRTSVLPPMAIYGPKVMVINQYAGSGGDALPWYFKMSNIGTLVGKRTWGGLVGISGYPELMDGGSITAPRYGVEGTDGTFPVENHGIAPDVTVWQDPALVRKGHDPQLERAVQIALKQLKENPPKQFERPPWRNYHPQLPPLPEPVQRGR